MIATERQSSKKEDVEKVVDKNKVKFTVTSGGSGPVKTKGIPSAFVFDVSGKLIFHGHPSDREFDKAIKDALKEVKEEEEKPKKKSLTKGPLIAKRQWTNSEGKKISATVITLEEDKITFKLSNQKVVKYDLSKLIEADQETIKAAAAERAKEKEEAEKEAADNDE